VPAAVVCAAACTLAAVAWAYLLAGHGGYWRTDQRLPAATGEPAGGWPAVTAEIGRGGRLRVVQGTAPPAGWAGKVWAMQQGLLAAGDARYVLFTDADIACAPGTVEALVRAAEADGRGLVSQMALLRAQTQAERLLVPAFVYFFAQLYPFRRVNRPGSRTAAAAGGCMLVRKDFLNAAGGLQPIRGARIDDVAFGRLLKRSSPPVRCWLGLTTDVRSCRAYPRLADIWDMVARSAYTQLRYSPAMLAGTLAGLLWLYALPPAAALAGLGWLAADSARRYYAGRVVSAGKSAKASGGGQEQVRWRSP
jgi:hopene-associated glycosyltransferase HpnB